MYSEWIHNATNITFQIRILILLTLIEMRKKTFLFEMLTASLRQLFLRQWFWYLMT